MVRRKDLLGDDERRSIEEAIAEAERRTSAEFVVVVARRSGRYDRSEDLFGLLLACVVLSVISIVWRSPGPVGSWDTTLRIPLGLPLTLVAIAAAFAIGAALATWFPVLSRPFRTRGEMSAEVRRRAADCFTDFRVRERGEGRGVLVYVSMLERTVWITADDAVVAKADPRVWERVRDEVVRGIRGGVISAGVRDGLKNAANSLAEVLPPREAPAGRLPNAVRVV